MLSKHLQLMITGFLVMLSPFATMAQVFPNIHFVSEHFPPYQIEDSKGNVHGFSTEIVNALMAHTPYQYDIRIYPWMRAYHLAQVEANTCIYLMSREKHREKLFQWVAPILPTTDYFIGLKENSSIKINSIDDAKRYRVAVLKEDRTHSMLRDWGFIEQHNLYVIESTYSMLKLLMQRKEIDLILADTINVVYRAKYNNIDPDLFKAYFKVSDKPVDLYLACSLATPAEVVDDLAKALATIRANGEFDRINQKWNLIATPFNHQN